ncbi:MAG: ATPase [Peptococcaceae bacterium BICA1-7]|nr:MAG: ATPase [Peptococcaceae bacterium BICA1-7]HBV96532.1 calcium-translocating P-type ATPase, SERCA-type [Desulfotomaculum sp.]
MSGQWHKMAVREVLEALQVDSARGLGEREAEERLARFGPNEMAKAPPAPLWRLFINQFKDFLVMVLLAATVLSGFMGEYADAVTIMFIVIINAILGCFQEYRAERSLEALKRLAAPEARVLREGREQKVTASGLVPGDIVLMEAGDKIAADIRLTEAINLEIEESALTGESVPTKKSTHPISSPVANPGDIKNTAFMGTSVTRGRGRGVVVATGMSTEMGNIAFMIQEAGQEPTPLQRRLGQLGKWLVAFCLLICVVVVVLGVYRGEPVYYMIMAGISLAVAAIPEGLPAIVTVALAIGVQRMIRRRAIIRRLPAVETLGCATVICSDKTGTLTQNKMVVRRASAGESVAEIAGDGYDPKGEINFVRGGAGPEFHMLLKIAALCNNSRLKKGEIGIGGLFRGIPGRKEKRDWDIDGDPTEGALLVLAAKEGFWRERLQEKEPRVAELPFDSDRKRMTVVCSSGPGKYTAYTKGAPDIILELCTHRYVKGAIIPLSVEGRREILAEASEMAGDALRVLAFAFRELEEKSEDYGGEENSLIFVGLCGMIDPPRPSAVSAVHTCRRAGIHVAMITGDHQSTARAVAMELGLLARGGKVVAGSDLDRMSDQDLTSQCGQVAVYARVSPSHKLRIVKALKQAGHVVAMTGDGVNDAPAVKEADIGISMGLAGTDVTREASSMILADDNFSTIVAAVEEGRGIYDNIRKFIRYLLSCNVGEVLVMFLAVLGGLPLPLMPIQILWMNLVTDGLPALALGVDPVDREIMSRRPRQPRESVFANGLLLRIIGSGSAIAAVTLLAFMMCYRGSGDIDYARTMAFNTLVFAQLFYVFSCRSERQTIFDVGIHTNPQLLGAVALSAALQGAVTHIPSLNSIFHTVPLNIFQWGLVALLAAIPTAGGIMLKSIKDRARKNIAYLRV